MDKLIFNPKNHTYTIDGKKLTGVTTILSVISKPALISWSANCAVDYIDAKLPVKRDKNTLKVDADDFKSILEQARKAHTVKRDKAGDIGTLVHKQIEKWINGEPIDKMTLQAQKMFRNFTNWATENKVKFLASERQVYSEKHFFAGTYDFLCKMDGKIFLGDIKTGSRIYPEHLAQCAAYQICEEEMNETKINGHIIVNLKKDGTIQTKTNYDFNGYKKMFLSALVIYRQLKNND
jgi:hypothetical protein|tara:strand:- start:2866 stop:3573 length:708 start_codon:yes stop_codon:yes gene_type:complete